MNDTDKWHKLPSLKQCHKAHVRSPRFQSTYHNVWQFSFKESLRPTNHQQLVCVPDANECGPKLILPFITFTIHCWYSPFCMYSLTLIFLSRKTTLYGCLFTFIHEKFTLIQLFKRYEVGEDHGKLTLSLWWF